MSTFFGLNIASRGLAASQKSLSVIAHNITNANTDGYTRQICSQKASTPLKSYNGTGMMGTGVDIDKVIQVRNTYLDKKYRDESTLYNEWSTRQTIFEELEGIFDESSDSGIDKLLDDFYAAMEEVSKDAGSDANRSLMKQNAVSLCKQLNSVSKKLLEKRDELNRSIKTKAGEINSYARQIRDLNEQIFKAELGGTIANDLRDQRNLLVDELSKIADIEASEVSLGENDKRFQIYMNGSYLVDHFEANELVCYEMEAGAAAEGMYGIKWDKSGMDLKLCGGELKGCMDIRDGDGSSGSTKGIPYLLEQLDDFASSFAKAFNEGIFQDGQQHYNGHSKGTGLDGSMGIRFFTYDNLSSEEFISGGSSTDAAYEKITALNISISADIDQDPRKIAASSSSGQSSDNNNMESLLKLLKDNQLFDSGSAEDYIGNIVSTLGIETQTAKKMVQNQHNLLNFVGKQRMSVSNVSVDEETAEMVRYQQAYNAAAKVMTVMDEIINTTINGLDAG